MMKPSSLSVGAPEKPSESREMDLQHLLLDIVKSLNKDEEKALAFLCTDLLGRNPGLVTSSQDLFSGLVDRGLLTPDSHLLAELLVTIQRYRLVHDLGLSDATSPSNSFISPYRKLLYHLSEQITDDELKQIKFLLRNIIPRRNLDENVTTLELFLVMEHMDFISESNLNKLETIFERVCPVLNKIINNFKAQQRDPTNPLAKEASRPRAMTYPVEPQVSPSILKTELPVRTAVMENVPIQKRRSSLKRETSHKKNTEGLETYPMTAAKRGVCLVVNNYDFTQSAMNFNQREGTKLDEKSLRSVFEWLGFEMQIHNDCTRHQMVSLLQDLSRRDHSLMDCVACCVLSHGQEGSVYGVDGVPVRISEMTDLLDGKKCPSLAGKPKLFFIQACQGIEKQEPVYLEADSSTSSPVSSDARGAHQSIPAGADFLQSMSTVPSFVSFRDRRSGSWFIQSLCQNLIQMVPSGCDLVSILTKVNADVSQKSGFPGGKKQMPQPAFSLRKKVIFPVPSDPPPSL